MPGELCGSEVWAGLPVFAALDRNPCQRPSCLATPFVPSINGVVSLEVLHYTLAQGAQFVSLAYLLAARVSLLLNLTPALVELTGMSMGMGGPVL